MSLSFLHAIGWPLAERCIGLFVAPFVHEDAAVVAGGLLVAHRQISVQLAALSLFLGIIASDIALYALGALARQYPLLRRFLPHHEALQSWLGGRFVPAVAICRVLPGVLGPVFIACGFFDLCFRRFVITNLCTALVYTGVMLAVVTRVGAHFDASTVSHVGFAAMALVLGARVLAPSQPQWRVTERLLGSRNPGKTHGPFAPTHCGMPHLVGPVIAPSERLPPLLFYTPIAVGWVARGIRYRSLTLPALANPLIEGGGLWGESKSGCMRGIARDYLAPFVTIANAGAEACAEALAAMAHEGLSFPIVAKPDIGWQGFGVRLIDDAAALREYLAAYPRGEQVILQHYVPFDGEAGILYARTPGTQRGKIHALTLRYFPFVVGDGISTLRALIDADARMRFKARARSGGNVLYGSLARDQLDAIPQQGTVIRLALIGSLRIGGIYRNGDRHITDRLSDAVDEIARGIPEFHYGRFDVRFRSIVALEAGDFQIIEVNGAGAEAINIWDPEASLRQVYADLFRHQEILFRIGALNRARGYEPISAGALLRLAYRQNDLVRRYPVSM